MRHFNLAARMLRRDGRSGELTILFAALVIAVSAVLTISLITDRLERALSQQSAELIGGDLVIESTREPDPAWREAGRELGLSTARVYRFQSVLFHGEAMQLCSIKAVSPEYPLLGQLQVREEPGTDATPVNGIPEPGSAWVDARVLEQLDAAVGDEINFGATTLRIDRILTFEPDQSTSLFQFAPRVLVNVADLKPARVLGPGSRIRYRTLFHGEPGAIDRLQQRLAPPLGPGHELLTPTAGDNTASEALRRATEYIRIATLLAIALAAIAIALTSRRYSQRHFDVSAMLRCLGARHRDIVQLYLYQLLMLTVTATGLAAGLGWLAHWAILQILAPLMPVALPEPGPEPWLVAGGSAFLLVAGFALPPVLRLARTPPLRVLQRELSPLPLSVWLVYGLAATSQVALLWLLFEDLSDVFVVLLATALALLAVAGLVYLGLRALRGRLAGGGLVGRSLRNLAAHAATSTSQIMAFGITLLILIVIVQLRTGLLEEWQLQLPADAPNHFAFNLFPRQVDDFRRKVEPVADLSPFYPVVRGRLLTINGEPRTTRGDEGGDRELNLTWTEQLPEDNEIVAGTWPPEDDGVSIERGFARELGVSLGDRLGFNVGGEEFRARITSLRTVVWESFSPNFFLIFSEQLLGDMPATYLTSFHLPEGHGNLLRELSAAFPAMTLIQVDAIIERLEQVLGQVSLSVEMVMVFVLLGGFAVLFATLQATADERLREGALMRALGASRGYLKRAYLTEFALLGFAAGGLAVVGAEIATALIHEQVFGLDFRPSPWLWLSVPPATAAAVATAGYLGVRKVLQVSPVLLLNT